MHWLWAYFLSVFCHTESLGKDFAMGIEKVKRFSSGKDQTVSSVTNGPQSGKENEDKIHVSQSPPEAMPVDVVVAEREREEKVKSDKGAK